MDIPSIVIRLAAGQPGDPPTQSLAYLKFYIEQVFFYKTMSFKDFS